MSEPLATVGRYHVVRLIAHGGMGSLYLARDPAIERLVAIKLLKDGFDGMEARERFAREARAAGRLHHPNIVTIYDVGEHEDRPFIAMEYVPGETLAQLIRRRAIRRVSEKLALLEELCAALHYAHGAGIVHRDIKPANVMVGESGVLKVLDFGIARAGGLDVTRVGDVVGTLNYMSPEQLAGHQVDHRSDIYSVGALAYELVTNQMSFPGTVSTGVLPRILSSAPPPISAVVPEIDPDIPAIIEHAMEKDPDARYQTLEDMRQDLADVRARLVERGEDVEEAPSEEAETRFYSGLAPSHPLRSSQRARPVLPSNARSSAIHSARPTRGKTGIRKVVHAGLAVAAVATALATAFLVTRSPDEASPSPAAMASHQAQPEAATVQTTPPSNGRQANGSNPAAVEEQLSAWRTKARQQIAAGERQAALDTLIGALALEPTDPEINALVDNLTRVAKRTATEARAAATRRGGNSSMEFRAAESREHEAESLIRAGDRIPAIRAFWAAAASYNQLLRGRAAEAAPSAATSSVTVPPAPPAGQPAEPPATPSSETIPSPPAPITPNRTAGDKTVPAPLPGALKPEPPSANPGPARDPVAQQTAAIRDTLRRYTQAYGSLDRAAVGEVMPALTSDQLRDLGRDFANYRSYTVEIRDERITVEGATATVTCEIVRSFETKTGVAGRNTRESVFHLRRIGDGWRIERLDSR